MIEPRSCKAVFRTPEQFAQRGILHQLFGRFGRSLSMTQMLDRARLFYCINDDLPWLLGRGRRRRLPRGHRRDRKRARSALPWRRLLVWLF